MILFKKDWENYSSAIVDTGSTNESFVRLAYVYKKMGIANWAFPLALLQPSLQGVDPFSEDLDKETMTAISLECRWNPWYAVREVIRLPPQGSIEPIRFKANRANIAMMWGFFNHRDFALIQPRQTGKSASTDCLWVTLLYLMAVNTSIQLVTKDHALRASNVERLKFIADLLPPYLNATTNKDVRNTEAVTCMAKGNRYKTAVGGLSIAGANKLGRGLTSPILQFDEAPFIENIKISLSVALSSATAARDILKKTGGFYGNVYTTTAAKRDTVGGAYIYDIITEGMFWSEILLDSYDEDDLVKTLETNSPGATSLINGTFSHRALGRSNEWLRTAIKESKSNKETAESDYLNIWGTGTSSNPLTGELLSVIYDSEKDPTWTILSKDNYLINWYLPRKILDLTMQSKPIALGLDSSNAIGKDANSLIFRDLTNLNVLGTASISEANLYKFALWILKLMLEYPNVVLIIENKSSAQGIIDVLLASLPGHGIDPFKRIYSRLVENIDKYPDGEEILKTPLSHRDPNVYTKYKSLFGFMTTGNSRDYLYSTVLQEAALTSGHLVNDIRLSSEIRGLVTKNNRVDHGQGGHDDSCIAWLMTQYLAGHSKNLRYYSMDSKRILSNVSDAGATETDLERIQSQKRAELRLEIETLKLELAKAENSTAYLNIERVLIGKVKESELDGGVQYTIDAIVTEATAMRKKKNNLCKTLKNLMR